MRKLYFFHYSIVFILCVKSITGWGQATLPTDYFRSAKSGTWDAASTWESSPDGSVNWTTSTLAPTSGANTIIIRSGHRVTIINNTTTDQVVVASGGILDVATGTGSILTVTNGEGHDIIVQNGAVFRHTGASLPAFNGLATVEIQGGGVLEAANNNVNASDYANTASAVIASHVLWAEGSIFNWNSSVSPPGVTYFPSSSAIPIFRFSQPVSIGLSLVINGLLEANNVTVSLQGSNPKIFRNGIIGTGNVTPTAVSVGKFIIDGTTATLGGTGEIFLADSLLISSGTTLTLTSDKKINKYSTGSAPIKNSGTIIAGDFIIGGNTKIQIEGTVKTTNVNGLSGGTNTTFATASGFSVNTPGASSVIEYNRQGDQVVTIPLTYKNLIISGSGSKTAAAGSDIFVSGIMNIMPGNTFTLNGTNNLKLNGGGTININADAVFDNGGESQVSGGGMPTINISGTFITRDADGFSGSGTSISGSNITLNILPGSTIEYGKMGNQDVTSRDDYKNLTFSGGGIKTIPTCIPKGTVTIKDNVIADASNKTFGDSTTSLTMTSGQFKVGGTGTKPDIAGTYTLTGGVIEFTNSGLTKQTIRSPRTYLNIEVSGSNVGNSKGITTLAEGGSFTVKTGGSFDNGGYRIDGIEGNQTFIMEAGAAFKTEVKGGFSGNDSAALKNIETLIINPKSTIAYTRSGNQTISPLSAYPTLLLMGSGIKTVSGGTVTLAAAADSVVIDTLAVFKVSTGAKVDFQGRPVFVRSNAGGTGMIGEITDGSSALLNATDVTVERFIPARRSFRFLSPSVTTKGSIKANWMEGEVNPTTAPTKNPKPGYGTNITGRNPTSNGFDPTITNNPSLFVFNTLTQKWDSVPNTNGALKAGDAYRLMVRGDRSIDMRKPDNYPTPTNTILRAKSGTLLTGTFSPALSTNDTGYTLIGNPYASPVDFKEMIAYNKTLDKVTGTANNIKPEYTVWDPKLSRRGAYVTYNAVTGTSNDTSEVDQNIQSGQAFFVQTIGKNSSPQIQFKESYKSSGNTKVFRNPHQITKLSVQLLLNLNEGLENNTDGVTAFFDENFSNNIGNEDSYKFTNLDENLAINRNGAALSMEGRASVTADDTIPLKMWQFRQNLYYLRFNASNFSPLVTAFVKDAYLHQETPIDLASVTLLPFSIDTAVPISFAIDRFSIVFKAGRALPVTLIDVKAYQEGKGIQVDYTVQSEINIDRYEVERSVDGQQFEKVNGVIARNNNTVAENYGWFDANVNAGSNFYRIKVIEKSGMVKYSEIVKVNITEGNGRLTVFPNPVKGNVIQVQLNNMDKGRYSANLYNNLGQKLYSHTIEHIARSGTYTISSGRLISKGTYTLHISKGDTIITEKVIVE